MLKPLAILFAALALLAGTASAGTTGTTIHLKLPATTSHYVDLGRKGYSGGDYFVVTGRVLDAANGKPAGRLAGIWTIVSRASDTASFDVGLDRGTLIVTGHIVHAAPKSTLHVVGGTGLYANAHGTVTFRYTGETTAALDVRLR